MVGDAPKDEQRYVCVGDVMSDVVATLTGSIALGSDAPATIRSTCGGSAANTAAWLAHAGHDATFVGRVGADPAGTIATDALERAGVKVLASRDPVRPTGTCIVLVTSDGERSMIPDAGANAGLSPGDLPPGLFSASTHLHLSGYALLNQGSRAAGMAALEQARAAGSTISIDPSSAGPLAAVGPQTFLAWVGPCDALLANSDEALVLTGIGDPAEAARAMTSAFTEVVITLGAKGAVWAGRGSDRVVHVEAAPVDANDVIDTTGAGDAFTAGWLPSALGGAEPAEALRAGVELAARAVARPGARPN